MVHELYEGFDIEVIDTKRNINSRATGRLGQDVIIASRPKSRAISVSQPEPDQMNRFPTTRYMGSKRQLLDHIATATSGLEFDTFVDLFAGSNVVSYLFKSMGKRVIANDFLAMSHQMGAALIGNNSVRLTDSEIAWILEAQLPHDDFVSRTFQGLYFADEDNALIDQIRGNISALSHPVKKAIAVAALVRACVKKRPRGIFTYVGFRYDDGRLDLRTSLADHFVAAAQSINGAVFDNGQKNVSRRGNAMNVGSYKRALVYLDPPYFSPRSDNEYVRRYHFVEGLAQNWEGLEIQHETLTKKFKAYPTPFSTRQGAYAAFETLFRRHRGSHILVSYASNGLPTLDEIVELLQRFKETVDVHRVDHRYSFGNQGHLHNNKNNSVEEYLFLAY
jgi:DNA adenine methylase